MMMLTISSVQLRPFGWCIYVNLFRMISILATCCWLVVVFSSEQQVVASRPNVPANTYYPIPDHRHSQPDDFTNQSIKDKNDRSIYSSLLKIMYQLSKQIERNNDKLSSRSDSSPSEESTSKSNNAMVSKSRTKSSDDVKKSSNDSSSISTIDVTSEPYHQIDDNQLEISREKGGQQLDNSTENRPPSTRAPTARFLDHRTASTTLFKKQTTPFPSTIRYSTRFSPIAATTRRSSSSSGQSSAVDTSESDTDDEGDDTTLEPGIRSPLSSMSPNSGNPDIVYDSKIPFQQSYSFAERDTDLLRPLFLNEHSHSAGQTAYSRRQGQKGQFFTHQNGGLDYLGSSSDRLEQHKQLEGLDDEPVHQGGGGGGSSSISKSEALNEQPNNRWPKLNPHNIQLQQVYGSSNPSFRPAMSLSHYPNTNSKSPSTSSSTRGYYSSVDVGQTTGQQQIPSLATFESMTQATHQQQQQQQQQPSQQQLPQKDLLNQPQTIQITAIPNGGGLGLTNANNPIIRVNSGLVTPTAFGQFNNLGLWNNGLGNTDPLGRQVLMVNADRRQVDWSVWIWPILAVVTLPLVLGALFVPVFLKTVVALIQILQSLGLLLPLANALSQQMVVQTAAGPTSSNQQLLEQSNQKLNTIMN